MGSASLKIHRLVDTVQVTLDLLNPRINRLQESVADYYCSKFQVIPTRGSFYRASI